MTPGHRWVSPADRVLIWELAGTPRIEPVNVVSSNDIDGEPIMCPSQTTREGSTILGHIVPGERMVRITPRSTSDDAAPPPPGASARIAGECRRGHCAYWADSCQLAAVAVHESDTIGRLPTCPIRRRCRWWLEQGPGACGTCDLVSYTMESSVA